MSMREPIAEAVDVSELQTYRNYVQKVADAEDVQELIFNRTKQHAAVIIEIMFAKAQETIQILTGALMPAVYGTEDVIKLAKKFLERPQSEIRIIAETPIDLQTHPLFAALRTQNLLNKVQLWQAPPDVVSTYPHHFIVVDGRHFRYEKSRDAHEAFIQFGTTEVGSKLKQTFADLEQRSKKVSLT